MATTDGKLEYTLGICVRGRFNDLEEADAAADEIGRTLIAQGYTNLEAGATPTEDGVTMSELQGGGGDDDDPEES